MAFSLSSKLRMLTLAAALAGVTTPAAATVLAVAIDTSSLRGTAAQLAFDLTDGDRIANNSVTITAFHTDGALGAATTAGGVTGALPGTVTLTDADFFNELLQPITVAAAIRFTLSLTDNFAGGPLPDQLALFLLDAAGSTPLFATSDPTGDGALFAVDLGAPGGLQVFHATDIPSVATWTVTTAAIPEPGALVLFATGLLGLIGRRRR